MRDGFVGLDQGLVAEVGISLRRGEEGFLTSGSVGGHLEACQWERHFEGLAEIGQPKGRFDGGSVAGFDYAEEFFFGTIREGGFGFLLGLERSRRDDIELGKKALKGTGFAGGEWFIDERFILSVRTEDGGGPIDRFGHAVSFAIDGDLKFSWSDDGALALGDLLSDLALSRRRVESAVGEFPIVADGFHAHFLAETLNGEFSVLAGVEDGFAAGGGFTGGDMEVADAVGADVGGFPTFAAEGRVGIGGGRVGTMEENEENR